MNVRVPFDSNLIKAMEVFVAVVETGQMTAGARMLGMTQSAASQHVALLERVFEAKLIDRSVRPLRLTPAGTLMQRHALRILNAVGDLTTDMRHEGPHPISVLKIALLASVATTLTPELVCLTRDRFGVEDLTLRAGISEDHEQLLRTRRTDIAITSNPLYDMDGLDRYGVLKESFLLVLPKGYKGPRTRLEQILKHLPLVRFADTTSVGRRIEQHLRRLKLQPPRVIQADRSSMVTACVARGMGFTLLTPSLLIDGLVEGMALDVRPLPAAGMSREITVVLREGGMSDLPIAIAETAKTTLVRQIDQYLGTVGLAALDVS